ncbi:hypothetical protein Tco_1560607, partial [Tanacetum coccineum]
LPMKVLASLDAHAPQNPSHQSDLTRIAKLAIHVRLTCASSLCRNYTKPISLCAFLALTWLDHESELMIALDLTELTLPLCLGALE